MQHNLFYVLVFCCCFWLISQQLLITYISAIYCWQDLGNRVILV